MVQSALSSPSSDLDNMELAKLHHYIIRLREGSVSQRAAQKDATALMLPLGAFCRLAFIDSCPMPAAKWLIGQTQPCPETLPPLVPTLGEGWRRSSRHRLLARVSR